MQETESVDQEIITPETAAQTPQKGSLWPPVAIMGILVLLGFALFFFL